MIHLLQIEVLSPLGTSNSNLIVDRQKVGWNLTMSQVEVFGTDD